MTKFAKKMILTHLRYALELAEATATPQSPLVDLRGDLAAAIVQVEETPLYDYNECWRQLTLASIPGEA